MSTVDDFLVYWDTLARFLSIHGVGRVAGAAELECAASVYPLATLRTAARRKGAARSPAYTCLRDM